MTEALLTGVPMVMMPGWMDQRTNASLAEALWGVGVRADEGADGVVEAAELRRCIDLVMGDGAKGEMIRKRAEEWREKAAAAISDDGSSTKNMDAFLKGLL
ncbi:hypothetical protein HPP92_008211 [Vanilla planifolia]|uniref:Uncharacterized protein n=1 Tax=Vanilla planifolia TaxID=51239 RepID=A0A835VA46_VANPL|nr:hypothetical protein HPP92_008211 [Vanilla planifolia]